MKVDVPDYDVADRVELDPGTTALVVIDMQHDFVSDGGTLQGVDTQATVPVIADLLDRARAAGAFVVFSQDTHREGDPEWEIWPEHAREGTWGWEIVPELAPREEDLVVPKPRYDAFYGTSLDHELRRRGIETLVICGTVANICVHYTAASAALRWYRVVIPKDATSALDPFDLESSLRQTAFLFAGTVTTAPGVRWRRLASAGESEACAST